MEEQHRNTGKRFSIQSGAPPVLRYRNSIDLPAIVIPVDLNDRKKSFNGSQEERHPWDEKPDPNAPEDKFNLVRITLFILGFTGLLPMTMLITANEYWMYKFRDVNTDWANYSASNRTELQVNFASYSMVAGIVPSVFFNFISTFIGHKMRMNTRARLYFFLLVAVFVINTIFTDVDTDSWQTGFFWLTMSSQVLLSFAGSLGVVILPITTKFPKKYLLSHLVGNGLAGMVTSVMRLISITCSPSTTGSALIYFGTGTALMFCSGLLFELMKITKYYKYHVTSNEEADTKKEINSMRTILQITKKIWPILVLNSIAIFIPTGAITALVVSENQGSGGLWSDKYFVTTATYLLPAIAEIIGRVISNKFMNVCLNAKFMSLATVARIIIFVPLIYMSNAQPRHHLPVWLTHDWEYMVMYFVHAILLGFLMNLGMFWTTSLVPHDQMELGFRIIMMFLGAIGSLSSPLNVLAVKII